MQFVKELFEEKVLLIKHFQMSNEKKVIVGREANQIIDCNVQIVKIQIEYTNQFKTTKGIIWTLKGVRCSASYTQ